MKRQFKNSMYDEDPVTGKRILLPLQLDLFLPNGNSNKKKKIEAEAERRKAIMNLKPLRLPDLEATKKKNVEAESRKTITNLKPLRLPDFEEPPAKIGKTDSVRKGLFAKTQVKPNGPARVSLVKRNSTRASLGTKKTMKAPVRKISSSSSSPLLNLEDVEEELLSKRASLRGYPFKSPKTPTFTFSARSKPLNIPKVIIEEPQNTQNENNQEENVEPKTPDSRGSSEFLKLEQMCIDSPVSSMCSLLQGTGLNSIKKDRPNPRGQVDGNMILKGLENILECEETAFKSYREIHERNVVNFKNLITSCKKLLMPQECEESLPISNQRRSIRLLNRSPSRHLVSPGILKSSDLRKSTLKRNLAAKSTEFPCTSPKPTVLFRDSKQSILETPKTDRKGFAIGESPGMRYISKIAENQSQMLQDTPVHK